MDKILILANFDVGLYKFRKELIQELIKKYEVYISLPNGEYIPELQKMGCYFIETELDRRGTNIVSEITLINFYRKIMKKLKPDVVLSYTVKPNIYGGLVSRFLKIPFIPNITGLGTALENEGLLKKILLKMYKYSLSHSQTVFFQNQRNQHFFEENGIVLESQDLLPGSGVNIDEYDLLKYPNNDEINFVFISRIMKDKGIDHYLEAAKFIKKKYLNINFHICGFSEEDYENTLNELHRDGTIIYHGMVEDVTEILKNMHCIVQPSYHEGMSNVLLEAAASGRPIIASNISGCRETFDEGTTGFAVPKKDTEALISAIERFIHLSNEDREKMGINGRKKMEEEFDRKIVIDKYLDELERTLGE